MDMANSNISKKQRLGNAAAKKLPPSCRQLEGPIPIAEVKRTKQLLIGKNAMPPINVKHNSQIKLPHLHTSAALPRAAAASAAAAVKPKAASAAKPTAQSQSASNKMAPKQKINRSKCKKPANATKAPLELLVVGHQVNMHQMHTPISMSTKLPVASAHQKTKNVNLNFLSQWYSGNLRQCPTIDNNLHILEDGEFVYIYEACPTASESWPAQFELPNEFNSTAALNAQPLSVSQQVIDSRFLAELIDELLMREL